MFQNPFYCSADDVPVELQLELIDLQANDLLKERHREETLVEFYRYLPDVEFPSRVPDELETQPIKNVCQLINNFD